MFFKMSEKWYFLLFLVILQKIGKNLERWMLSCMTDRQMTHSLNHSLTE